MEDTAALSGEVLCEGKGHFWVFFFHRDAKHTRQMTREASLTCNDTHHRSFFRCLEGEGSSLFVGVWETYGVRPSELDHAGRSTRCLACGLASFCARLPSVLRILKERESFSVVLASQRERLEVGDAGV
jgi:hypothetical protein